MKIENLKVGMVIKNYKMVCELLDEEIKTGGAKQNQLKYWNEYFNFHKKGNKFIIDKIYDKEMKPMKDNRKGNSGTSQGSRNNNIPKYTQNIERLILDLLSQSKQGYGKIFLSKHVLLRELKMINNNFSYCKQRLTKLSKFMNIDKATIEEWYDSTSDMLERNLETALKNLEKQSLILWSREITVAEIIPIADIINTNRIIKTVTLDKYNEEITDYKINDRATINHREGTEEEKRFILYTEREILKEMNCKNKADVIAMGEWENFINKVNSIILKEYNIGFYYKSYKILFNEQHIIEAMEDDYGFELDEDDKIHEQIVLNRGVNDRIHNNATKRQDKAQAKVNKMFGKIKDERLIRRTNENYMKDNDKLNSNLIDVKAKDIKNKVKTTKIY